VADERGIAHIDARTNLLTPVGGIHGNCGGGGGVVWRRVVGPAGIGARFLSFSDGILWIANYDAGTVTGIDAVTTE
jgi:hypothetical protein